MQSSETLLIRPEIGDRTFEILVTYRERHSRTRSSIAVDVFPLMQFRRGPFTHRASALAIPDFRHCYPFELLLNHRERMASFASMRDVLSPDYLGGTVAAYAFARMIAWGRQHGTDYPVQPIPLLHQNADSEERRAQRSRFYQNLGFALGFRQEGTKTSTEAYADALDLLSNSFTSNDIIRHMDGAQRIRELIIENDRLKADLEKAHAQIAQARTEQAQHKRLLRSGWLLLGAVCIIGAILAVSLSRQ